MSGGKENLYSTGIATDLWRLNAD